MSFLSPLWLALAGAVAVPILLHVLRRRIGVRVDFPAVRYLLRAEREHSRSLKVRGWLLLALRLLAVLALALAAARPLARVPGATHAPTALAIVVDNSMSSGVVVNGAPLLDSLRAAAAAAIAQASAGDKLWLLTADGRVVGGSAVTLRDALARVTPYAGAGDPAAALQRAVALVRNSGLPNGSVLLVTDGQPSSWPERLQLGNTHVSAFVPRVTFPANHAVVSAHASPTRWTPTGLVTATLRTPDSAAWRITLGDQTIARGTAGAGQAIDVHAAPDARGWVAGSVALEPDELRADDVRWFAAWVGPSVAVRVDPSAGRFASDAVDALVANGAVVRTTTAGAIRVTGADALDGRPAVIFPPSDPVRLGAANRTMERLDIPWRFGALVRANERVRDARLDGATVAARYTLAHNGSAPSDTLATSGGAPWIVAGDGYVLVASPLDPAATSLPVQASFAPWLADMLTQRLSGAAGSQLIDTTPGATVTVPGDADALASPDGSTQPVRSGTRITLPDAPGVYLFRRGAEAMSAVVINAEPGESELGQLSNRVFASRLGARDVSVDADRREWMRSAFSGEGRRNLAGALLVIALLALVGESVLARTTPTA